MAITTVIPSHKFKYATGKQSAFGTPAANPDYQTPVYTASLLPQETRTDIDVIQGSAYASVGQLKSQAFGAGDVEWASLAASLPRYCAMHFGTASDTVTGAGDPYTHTMVRKDTQLPHTIWVSKPAAGGTFEHDRLQDCVAKTLTFRYANGELFHVPTSILAGSSTGIATAPTPGTTETVTPTLYGHTWRGATLLLDIDATPAVTAVTTLQNFEITCDYPDAALLWTQNLNPDFLSMGRWTMGMTASYIVSDWSYFNATFYGSKTPSANTAQSPTVFKGAATFTIQQEPSSANRTVVITMPSLNMWLDPPSPDAGGGPIIATLHAQLQDPGVGVDPITVAVKSAVATSFS